MSLTASWRKLLLTAAGVAAFAFFMVRGPLQELPPAFEFKVEMRGFAEPIRFGEEQRTRESGVVDAIEAHPEYGMVRARDPAPRLHGLIGDPRSNPGLKPETGELILVRARERAAYPAGVSLRRALELYFAEGRDAAGRPLELHLENTGLNRGIKGYAGPIDIGGRRRRRTAGSAPCATCDPRKRPAT